MFGTVDKAMRFHRAGLHDPMAGHGPIAKNAFPHAQPAIIFRFHLPIAPNGNEPICVLVRGWRKKFPIAKAFASQSIGYIIGGERHPPYAYQRLAFLQTRQWRFFCAQISKITFIDKILGGLGHMLPVDVGKLKMVLWLGWAS